MKSMVHILMAAFAALHASGWVVAAEPDPLRLLKAENKMLRATVQAREKQIAQLKAALAGARKENAKLVSAMKAAGVEVPGESTSKPSKPTATKPGPKLLTVADLVRVVRRTKKKGVTALQREAMLKGVLGQWATLSVEVAEVQNYVASVPFFPGDDSGAANVTGRYESQEMIVVERHFYKRTVNETVPAVLIDADIAMPIERAAKLKKGETVRVRGKIWKLRVVKWSAEGQVVLDIHLDAHRPVPSSR